jgi:hypothetical protein
MDDIGFQEAAPSRRSGTHRVDYDQGLLLDQELSWDEILTLGTRFDRHHTSSLEPFYARSSGRPRGPGLLDRYGDT